MTKRFKIITIIFLVTLVLGGVFRGKQLFQKLNPIPDIETFVTKYYDSSNAQDYDYIYNNMLNKRYQKAMDYETFCGFMGKVHEVIGNVDEKKRGAWNINYDRGMIVVSVTYEIICKNEVASESFVVVKSNNTWKLQKNTVHSDALIKALYTK